MVLDPPEHRLWIQIISTRIPLAVQVTGVAGDVEVEAHRPIEVVHIINTPPLHTTRNEIPVLRTNQQLDSSIQNTPTLSTSLNGSVKDLGCSTPIKIGKDFRVPSTERLIESQVR